MTLDQIAIKHGTDKASTHHDYCGVYESYFSPLRGLPITLLEIGVQFGPSIRTWLEYFPAAKIIGVDVSRQEDIKDDRYQFALGDQRDRKFWEALNPTPDVVIDDGSHQPADVIGAFEFLWAKLPPGGLYIVEDVFCFYRHPVIDGAPGREWLNSLLSAVNLAGKYYYSGESSGVLTDLEQTLEFAHFSKGLVVLKKRIGEPNLK